jgi:hypothetical protein
MKGFGVVATFVAVVLVACIYFVTTSNDLEWDKVHIKDVGTSSTITQKHLLVFRVCCAAVIWSLNLHLLTDSEGLSITLNDRTGKQKKMQLARLDRFTMFTVWCWTLEGVYFLLTSLVSYLTVSNKLYLLGGMAKPLERVIWVLFEVSRSAFVAHTTD